MKLDSCSLWWQSGTGSFKIFILWGEIASEFGGDKTAVFSNWLTVLGSGWDDFIMSILLFTLVVTNYRCCLLSVFNISCLNVSSWITDKTAVFVPD